MIYALHALAVLIGLTTMHTVVLSFVGGLPSIIAVIMNYARRSATVGTFLESHFRWQIRTFWYALLWALICFVLIVSILGIFVRADRLRRPRACGSSTAWCAAGWRCATGARCTYESGARH